MLGNKGMDGEARAKHLLSRTRRTASGCLEFCGAVQKNGYARATVWRKTDGAHRHVFKLLKGDIPRGADVCHTCDNRKCINPDHLFLGSRLDNMRDAAAKGRLSSGAKHAALVPRGEGSPMAKLNTDKVMFIRAMTGDAILPKQFARLFNVDVSLVRLVINRKIWRHI